MIDFMKNIYRLLENYAFRNDRSSNRQMYASKRDGNALIRHSLMNGLSAMKSIEYFEKNCAFSSIKLISFPHWIFCFFIVWRTTRDSCSFMAHFWFNSIALLFNSQSTKLNQIETRATIKQSKFSSTRSLYQTSMLVLLIAFDFVKIGNCEIRSYSNAIVSMFSWESNKINKNLIYCQVPSGKFNARSNIISGHTNVYLYKIIYYYCLIIVCNWAIHDGM